MSITFEWQDEEKRLMIATFADVWTWDDFHKKIREMHKAIETVPHKVDLLLWHKVHQPVGNPLIHFNKAARHQPANTGRIVVVASQPNSVTLSFLMSLSSIVKRIYPTKSAVSILTTMADAERVLGTKIKMHGAAVVN